MCVCIGMYMRMLVCIDYHSESKFSPHMFASAQLWFSFQKFHMYRALTT